MAHRDAEWAAVDPRPTVLPLWLPVGLVCLALGSALSVGFLERTVIPDGNLTNRPLRVGVRACQAVWILLGLFCLIRRPALSGSKLILALVSGLLALACAEAAVRAFVRPAPILSGWRGERAHLPSHEMNQLGFRGRPIDTSGDETIVVLLGDSQVAANAWPFEQMPERMLEAHLQRLGLNARVFSIGARGYGQDQQLLVLREYYAAGYRADWVVLWFTPDNDIWNNMFPTHWPANGWPKPTFWVDDGELLGPSESMGEEITGGPRLRLYALWRRALDPDIFPIDRDAFWERYLPAPYQPLEGYRGEINKAWQEACDQPFSPMQLENHGVEKTHQVLDLTPRSRRTEYGIALTRLLLSEIESLAHAHNGGFSLFRSGLPPRYRAGGEVFALNGRHYRVSDEQFEENMRDLFEGFVGWKIPVTLADWRTDAGDRHLNDRANDQMMSGLAERLAPLITETTTAAPSRIAPSPHPTVLGSTHE